MTKQVPPEATPMADHVPDTDGRCILCGQKANTLPCPGVPAEEEVTHDFSARDGFLPASDEYDPDHDAVDEYFSDLAAPRDPDKASFNVVCPVCSSRPCLPECKLGPWTLQDLERLNNLLPPLLPPEG